MRSHRSPDSFGCEHPMPPASAMRNDPLHRLFKAVEQAFRERLLTRLREAGVTELFPGTVPLLLHLGDEDGLPLMELGKRCGLEGSTMTPLVDELERHGIALRSRSTEDRRQVRIFLTENGRKLEHETRRIVLEMQDDALRAIDEADLSLMMRVMEKMVSNLNGEPNAKNRSS